MKKNEDYIRDLKDLLYDYEHGFATHSTYTMTTFNESSTANHLQSMIPIIEHNKIVDIQHDQFGMIIYFAGDEEYSIYKLYNHPTDDGKRILTHLEEWSLLKSREELEDECYPL